MRSAVAVLIIVMLYTFATGCGPSAAPLAPLAPDIKVEIRGPEGSLYRIHERTLYLIPDLTIPDDDIRVMLVLSRQQKNSFSFLYRGEKFDRWAIEVKCHVSQKVLGVRPKLEGIEFAYGCGDKPLNSLPDEVLRKIGLYIVKSPYLLSHGEEEPYPISLIPVDRFADYLSEYNSDTFPSAVLYWAQRFRARESWEDNRASLEGITEVRVAVEVKHLGRLGDKPLNSLPDEVLRKIGLYEDAELLGIDETVLKTAAELRLRLAGVKVSEEVGPFLHINVNLLPPRDSYVVLNVKVEFDQSATLRVNGKEMFVTTWSEARVGDVGKDNLRDTIREVINDIVDAFINDYLAANQNRPTTKKLQETP